MIRILITTLLLLGSALPSCGAPTTTTGPWGIDAGGFKNLSSALASPSTVGKTVVVSSPMSINNKTTDRAIELTAGGRINVASGKTVTFNGSFKAGLHQIFAGAGDVLFGSATVDEVHPEWWNGSISKAFKAFPVVKLVANTYTLNAETLMLDSPAIDLTYQLRGIGRQSKILLTGYNSDQYVFKLNDDGAGNAAHGYQAHPRFIVDNVFVDGGSSTSARFLWYNTASFQFKNLHFDHMKYGATGTGYTDSITLDNVYWDRGKAGGWLFEQNSNGDSIVINKVFMTGYPGIYLKKCAGATLSSLNGGMHVIEGSFAVKIQGSHFEQFDGTLLGAGNESMSQITIKNSQVSFDSNYIWNSRVTATAPVPAVLIDDVSLYGSGGSQVVFSNNKFISSQRPPAFAGTPHVKRSYDVYINQLRGNAQIRFTNNKAGFSRVLTTDAGATWSTLWDTNIFGIWVDASEDNLAALRTDILAKRGQFSTDVTIAYVGAYKVLSPTLADRFEVSAVGTPYMGVSLAEVTNAYSSLTAGTYYYRSAVYTLLGVTAKSSELSKAISNASAISMSIDNLPATGGILRIWRGTAADSYDRYVDIPIGGAGYLYAGTDYGTHYSGIAWITTGVPDPATLTTNWAYGGRFENGRKRIYATAMPTVGTYTIGDIVEHTDAALTGSGVYVTVNQKYTISGWYRITTGSGNVLNTDWVEMRSLTGQ